MLPAEGIAFISAITVCVMTTVFPLRLPRFLREYTKKASKRSGHSVHAHLQVDQIFQKRLSGHYHHPFSNLPLPIMQLSGVVNWCRPPLKCVKHSHHPQRGPFSQTLEPRKTSSSCFFFRRASCPGRQMFRGFHPPADKPANEQQSTANLYHSSVYKGTIVAHNLVLF